MPETQLTSVGPTVSPIKDTLVRAPSQKTEAWGDGKTTSSSNAAAPPERRFTPSASMKRKPLQKVAVCLVLMQALWAILVPVKNIATMFYPSTSPSEARTISLKYQYDREQPSVFPGHKLMPLLNQVLEIALSNDMVRQELETSGTFDIDRIYKLVSLDDFAVISQYYTLILQSSEFPGAVFTPRSFSPSSENEKLSILLRDSTTTATEPRDIPIDLACSSENAFLMATKCTRPDGYPCPAEYLQDNETRTYGDIDLHEISADSGLENSIGLLYMLDFFHQAMSALFAAKDWSAALEDLNYVQDVEKALEAGSLSGYKDNAPYIYDRDAFLVTVQAAQMETTMLDSCFASEVIVGQFYTRTFLLNTIQQALVAYDVFNGAKAAIAVPSTTEEILRPIFAFNLTITSGAQFGQGVREMHAYFLENFQVGSVHTATAYLKLDHRFNSANQVAGSSLRMVQYMTFYPELISIFESETRKMKGSGSGSDRYDVQNYRLIGASGAGMNTFKDSSTSANFWMVYPLAELGTLDAPLDSWWDDEREFAAWFKTQEADLSTAPFRVFDKYLKISSNAKVAPVDDDISTRCHRALFKVIGKITYLALVGLSKPTSYLMFMAEVPIEHRTWLLHQVYKEELVGESFFGERVAFPYRNGPYTRKDDGSAWVVIPLLQAMVEYYGRDQTLASILTELDRSFPDFVKTSNGDMQFPDTAYCHIDGLNLSTQVTTTGDTAKEIYTKLALGIEASLADLLALLPNLVTQMNAAMATKKISPIALSRDQILGSPVVTADTEGLGPPNDWKPSAFMAGMLKFWPPKTPLDETVQQLRASTRCYRMLDLQLMKKTMRCFAEPRNVRVSRRVVNSDRMREFFLSNWSMAVMLNTMAWVVVLKYLEKLWNAWRVTKFECLDVEVALQLNLQGMGVLSIAQSLLLLVATLPSLISFHIANDDDVETFLSRFNDERMSKIAIDFFVTLSMSWFMKVGFEFCNDIISPRRPVDWHYQFRLRWFLLVLIFALRLLAPDYKRDGAYQMWKLVATCIVALLLGACSTAVMFLPERRGKVVDGDRKDSHDAVVAALVKQNLPLNRYGVLGRTSRGWSKTGLLVEGWKVVATGKTNGDGGDGDGDGEVLLRKGAGEILLPRNIENSSDAVTPAAHGDENDKDRDEEEEDDVPLPTPSKL